MKTPPSGTVTFLFTDIEGSTRLWEEYGQVMQRALPRHDAIVRQAIESSNGHVFKTVGDGFCAVFSKASQAVTSALAAQQALTAEPWGEAAIRVRMALHTGAVEERDGDYFGPPLNRTARLLDAAHGCQILLSATVQELVRGDLPTNAQLKDLGQHHLRDLAQPEHIFQLLPPGLVVEFPPIRTLDAFKNNLPIQLTSFIGREREIAEVKKRFSTTNLLTLTGSGGVGKTRLAQHVAADLLDAFLDGVWLIELAPLADPLLVPQTVARALGVRESADGPVMTALTDHLRAKHLLLVLDNCEHLIEACAELADSLLRTCPNLRILGTSREVLGIAGEFAYRVPSLSLPPPLGVPHSEVLSHYEALRLFVDRAGAALPGFAMTPENAPVIANVCHRLDGIPLAIELAAARINMLRVEEISDRLDNSFRLLTAASRTAVPRHQTLRATIDWSHNLLSEDEQLMLRRLSVFAGGWTLQAAEEVCAGSDNEEIEMRPQTSSNHGSPTVLDLLAQLINKSLVVVEREQGQGTRYRLLEMIRKYAHERLLESGEGDVVAGRHLTYFLNLAEQARPALSGREQVAWFHRLEQEHDNFRAALESSFGSGKVEAALRLSAALAWFWWVRGYLREGNNWLTRGLAATEGPQQAPVSSLVQAEALNAAGMLAIHMGDSAGGNALYERALPLWTQLQLDNGVARCLNVFGNRAKGEGDYTRARALYEQALERVADAGLKATVLYNLAGVACGQHDYGRAISLFEEALELCEILEDATKIAWMHRGLGTVALEQKEHDRAATFLRKSLKGLWEVGEKIGIAEAFEFLASVAADSLQDLGGALRSARLFGAAELLRENIGAPLSTRERQEFDERIASVRNELGETKFAAAWQEGRALALEQSVEYALRDEKTATDQLP